MKTEQGIIGTHDYLAMKRLLKSAGYRSRSRVLASRKRKFSPHEKSALKRMIKNYARREGLPYEEDKKILKIGYIEGVVHNGVIDEIVFRGTRQECLEYLKNIKNFDRNALYKITIDDASYNPLLVDGVGYIKPDSAKRLRDFIKKSLDAKPEKSLDYERKKHEKGKKTIFFVVKTTRI